jgi:hypothetical protein
MQVGYERHSDVWWRYHRLITFRRLKEVFTHGVLLAEELSVKAICRGVFQTTMLAQLGVITNSVLLMFEKKPTGGARI